MYVLRQTNWNTMGGVQSSLALECHTQAHIVTLPEKEYLLFWTLIRVTLIKFSFVALALIDEYNRT